MDEKLVCSKVFAITSVCLQQGHLPTTKEALVRLFKDVGATKKEIQRLAEENKLYWLRDAHDPRPQEDYNKKMNQSLLHYLS